MKKHTDNLFNEYMAQQEDTADLQEFFAEFDTHCLLGKAEKHKIREDFEKALLYYAAAGVPRAEALERLDISRLGGFYSRPSGMWFPLDDAAKMYPLSMERGRMSVFRLSAYLKADIVPELLQMALSFTIKRFPSFATTLKKGVFWHYLNTTKRRFCIEPEDDIPCRPIKVSRSGSQSFRVLYYKNRISVEFFHVLTDGSGGLAFLKVLTAEYLRLTGIPVTPDEDLWDINADPTNEELENAFAKIPKSSTMSTPVSRYAVQMSGQLSRIKPCRIVHLLIDAAQLKATVEKYETTVTGYLLALMFIAGRSATDELTGTVGIQLPVNMRKFYPSKTVRNFVLHCGISLPIEKISTISDIIPAINEQLQTKASQEAMSEVLTFTENIVDLVKGIPLAAKQPVAKLSYDFLGDKIFSNILSNLGVVKMPPDLAQHIEKMDFVIGPAITHRARCAVGTFGGITTFSITKMTPDPTFEEKIYTLLQADNITVTAEGSEIYEN